MSDVMAEKERPARPGAGVLVAIVAVAVLTAFASFAPSAVRKLVLFSIAYGACVGGILAWASTEFRLSRQVGYGLTIVLTVCGLVAIALHGHQRLHQEAQLAAKKDPQQRLMMNLLKSAADDDPESAANYEQHRRRLNPTFADYLAVRLRPLGEWASPWPALFWPAEILLAVGAGLFLFWKLTRRRDILTPTSSPDVDRISETPEA